MKKTNIQETLNSRRYDPNQEPPQNQTILTIGGKKVGSLQNLVTITGKQKNGKSRYISAFISSGIIQSELFEIRLRTPHGRNRIGLFDTEQSDFDFYRQMQQIKDFCRVKDLPDTFDAFNTREDDPGIIVAMISHYLETNPDCSVIFIDGLLDLLSSFNDERESKALINTIKRLTKIHNCLMIGVLHRGKGNDLTIGHLGSMADRVSQSTLKVEKDKERNTFTLSADFLRSDEEFSPIDIWNVGGEWQQTFHIPQQEETHHRAVKPKPQDYPKEEYLQKRSIIFNGNEYLSYDQIVQAVKEIFGVGRNWAVDCVKHMRESGLIFRHPDGGYSYKQQTGMKLYIQE